MKLSKPFAVVAGALLVIAGLTACDQVKFGDPSPTTTPRVTVTETVSKQAPPTPTSESPTATPTPTTTQTEPPTTALPPNGAGAYTAVDASRFRLNPPTSVASFSFSVPSGNIACFAGSEFICEIHDGPNQSPTDSRCGFYGDEAEERVRIVGWFKYDRPPCSTILQGTWRDKGPMLNYGESVRFSLPGASISCFSATEALYCTGPQNYGFKLSREAFARYQLS